MCSSGKVSIIIPTHKDRDLTNIITSISKSTYKNYEIIIVDENKERSIQRNIGVQRAVGDYYLFLDSDMTISQFLLLDCVISIGRCDGLYIPEIIVGHPVKTLFRSFFNMTRIEAIRFIKKEYFIPFDENITGFEDWDFDRNFKGTKSITIFPLYHHTNATSIKKVYYLRWLFIYIKKHPISLLFELNPLYRIYLIMKGLWKNH